MENVLGSNTLSWAMLSVWVVLLLHSSYGYRNESVSKERTVAVAAMGSGWMSYYGMNVADSFGLPVEAILLIFVVGMAGLMIGSIYAAYLYTTE